jgi:hypothetical protein
VLLSKLPVITTLLLLRLLTHPLLLLSEAPLLLQQACQHTAVQGLQQCRLQLLVANPCWQDITHLWVLLQIEGKVEAPAVDLGAVGDPARAK